MTVDRDKTYSEWAMILVIASCTVTSRVNGSFDHTVVCMGDGHGWDWSLGFEMGVNIVIERARMQARA